MPGRGEGKGKAPSIFLPESGCPACGGEPGTFSFPLKNFGLWLDKWR